MSFGPADESKIPPNPNSLEQPDISTSVIAKDIKTKNLFIAHIFAI